MSNDARFEFVLIDGGSQSSGAPSPVPREGEDLRGLLESILQRGGVQLPQGTTGTPTTLPTSTPTETTLPAQPAATVSPDAGASPVLSPTPSPVTPPVSVPTSEIPTPRPRDATPVVIQPTPQRPSEVIPRPEPVPIPKVEPLPEPKPLPVPQPVKPDPVPSVTVPEPRDQQPTEPSKVPDRFVDMPQKEYPRPWTPEDLADQEQRRIPKGVDPIQTAEDLARQESADRMRRIAEEYNAERAKRQAEAAAKRKADHENAMQRSDAAIENRYGAVDAKKIFEELRADAKALADKTVGPSPMQTAGDIATAATSEAKDAAKAAATKVTGDIAEVAGKAAAGGAGAAGAAAGGGAGAAAAGIGATAATGALAGLAVAAPAMAFRSMEIYTDKIAQTIGNLSPELAMAQARADTAATFRRLEMAQQFGPDLARLKEADSDLKIAGSRIAGAFVGPIIEDFADLKEGIGNVAERIGEFVDNNKKWTEAISEGLIQGAGFGWIGQLGELMTWASGGGDQQKTLGTFLDELDFITPPDWDQAPRMDMESQEGLMIQ